MLAKKSDAGGLQAEIPLPPWISQHTYRRPIRLKDDAAKKRKRETEAKSLQHCV